MFSIFSQFLWPIQLKIEHLKYVFKHTELLKSQIYALSNTSFYLNPEHGASTFTIALFGMFFYPWHEARLR